MTMQERMRTVVAGRPVDRVPFVQYSGLAGPDQDIWEVIGRDQLGLLRWVQAASYHAPHCRTDHEPFEQDGLRGYRHTLHTPIGSLTQTKRLEPAYNSAATHEFYVKEPADYRILLAYFRDLQVRPNVDGVAQVAADLGDDGLPHLAVRRTPFQQLWVEWVCLDQLCLHLVDEPELLAEVIGVLRELESQTFAAVVEVARAVPVPWVVFPDNITAPAIGERYFREFCLPSYHRLRETLDAAGLDLPIHCHMDGDLRPLWGAIGASPIVGIDSLSPPPDNDTRVAEAFANWPGIRVFPNFPSSVHLAPDEEVYRVARELLEEGGRTGRFWIQISENVPRWAWRTSFPAIVRAIEEFGAG